MKRTLSQNSLDIFKNARNNNLFCDAILKTEDGGQFNVHKCILVICSSYFKTLFTKTSYGINEVSFLIPGVSKNVLDAIIDYAYIRKIRLNFRNVKGILSAADQLEMVNLIHDCTRFLMNKIDSRNCLSVWKLAKRFGLIELSNGCLEYLTKHFMEVAERCEDLMKASKSELVSFLINDELNIKEEELVWETVIRWIETDEDNRKNHIVDLMRCVRLGLVNTDYFVREIQNHPYVLGNDRCLPIVTETLNFTSNISDLDKNNAEFHTPDLACPRIPNEIMLAIGGWSKDGSKSSIEAYDIRADFWIPLKELSLSKPRACHRCVVISNEIYIIGGFNGKVYFNSCCRFNVVTKQWKDIGPMHCKRSYVTVAILDNVIYAMGGYDGNRRQNTAEKYDRFNNQWTMVAPMHFERSDASAAILNGYVYVAGGFNGRECLQSVEFYSPSLNQWTLVAPMRTRRSGLCCVSYKSQLYVLGGFNGTERIQSVELYNPRNGTWNYGSDMLARRSNFASAVLDDKIFAVGGYDGNSILTQIEYYNESLKQWCKADNMNICRFALAVCVVGNVPNVREYVHEERHEILELKSQRFLELHQQSEEHH